MLRGDPLLFPHFEKGDIHILPPDKADSDPIWIDFTLKEYIQDFIKGRVNANLFGMLDRVEDQAIRDWDDRVEMIKITEADERSMVTPQLLSLTKRRAGTFKVYIP